MIQTYRSTNTVQAIQINEAAIKELVKFYKPFKFYITQTKDGSKYAMLETSKKERIVRMGQFLVRGSENELLNYNADDFNKRYELVDKD